MSVNHCYEAVLLCPPNRFSVSLLYRPIRSSLINEIRILRGETKVAVEMKLWSCQIILLASIGSLATVGANDYCAFSYHEFCLSFRPEQAQRFQQGISSKPLPCRFGGGNKLVSGIPLTIVSQWRGGSSGGMRRGNPGGRDLRRDIGPKGPPMNSAITAPSVRVVVSGPDGKDEMLGIMSRDEALTIAEERVCSFSRLILSFSD